MGQFTDLWSKFTHSEALDNSGPLEIAFFEFTYRVTYIMGMSSAEKKTWYLLYKHFVESVAILLMCAEVGFVLFAGATFDDAAKVLGVFMLQCITQYRYRNMVSNKSVYKNLAKSMDSPYFDVSTEARQKIAATWTQKGKFYAKLLIILAHCSLWSWYIDPLVDDLEYNLVVDIYLPFNYKTPVLYPITYILVLLALNYAGCYVMVTAIIMQIHLIHVLCQYEILADCFENLLNDTIVGFKGIRKDDLEHNSEFAVKYTKRLGNLVEQHKNILRITKDLETAVSRPMLGQLGASGLMICFLGYELATNVEKGIVTTFVSFFFLAYNVFELFMICNWSEAITTWSAKIGKAIYFSGWEYGIANIPGVRSTMLIVFARSNDPVYLTAGGMYNLSIDSFARLIKGSYSALTVLLGTRDE